jgi:uncharacterized membrane protein YdjX (TVP38/TMEM64 family)
VDPRHWFKIAMALCAVGSAAWLIGSGTLSSFDAHTLREQLREAGAWGGLLFVLLFAVINPLGLSGHILVIGASLVWPPVWSFGLSLLAATTGQTLWFFLYRYLAREWAQSRIPQRLVRYEHALVERPLRTVLVFRLLSFTWPLAPAILGVSRVPVQPMLAGTVLGLAPTIAVDVWLGALLLNWLAR